MHYKPKLEHFLITVEIYKVAEHNKKALPIGNAFI